MKIIFFGSSGFSAQILEHLATAETGLDYEIVAVITQPDKPVGRKQEIQQSPVSIQATKVGIPVLKPDSLKSSEIAEEIKSLEPDLFVVVAYGKIIPANILEFAKVAPLNIHGSLLPKYRGASPIHAALLNGDAQTGITTMVMDPELDHGPTILSGTVTIGPDDTFVELEAKLCELAKSLILKTIEEVIEDNNPYKEQDHSKATFTKIISKEDGKIDWNQPAQQIYNQYRAYVVWPGVWTTYQSKTLKIKKCRPFPAQQHDNETGMVVSQDGKILVTCGEGFLELLEVQLEGKTTTDIKSFIQGHKDFIGSKLG